MPKFIKVINMKWKSLKRENILKKEPWFIITEETVELPNGKIINDYFNIKMPNYCSVFAIDKNDQVLLLRSYRHAIGEETITLPGGMIENNEKPIDGIKRELLEETGYIAQNWKGLGNYIGNSSRGCGNYFFFFADNATKIQNENSGDLEELELLLWSKDKIIQLINNNQIKSLGSISLLLLGIIDSDKNIYEAGKNKTELKS